MTGGELYTWLVALHGQLAILGLALLLHPIVTLRLRKSLSRNTLLTAELAALLVCAPFAIGLAIYPTYRTAVKPSLYLSHPDAVLRFETKEHLAAMGVALVLGGALTLRVAGRSPEGRDAGWMLLVGGWVLVALTLGLGLYVHGRAHPGFG